MMRLAVVSPFIDKRHGTERCVAEQVERLAREYGYEIHIYSQRVEDVEGVVTREKTAPEAPQGRGHIVWHRIPDIPGPHILKYLWWFVANHLWRWWDQRVRGIRYDLVYSPGINCLDVDVVAVHIVFAEFYRRVREDLRLTRNPVRSWPRLLHRHLYYRLIMALEERVYPRPEVNIAAVSGLTAREVVHHYRAFRDDVRVVHNSVDLERFTPEKRQQRRGEARQQLGLLPSHLGLILVGNDWKKKGLETLILALSSLPAEVVALVVGRDDPAPFLPLLKRSGTEARVRFLPPRPDVEFYYAAADVYVGPSLHDSFALPPLEAMACGLPVVTSINNGGAEIITHGVDGFVLRDARDPEELAHIIAHLYEDPDLRQRIGENAARTARAYTWEKNAKQMHALFTEVLARKRGHGSSAVANT